MAEIMQWKPKRCAPTPSDGAIRAMTNEQLGQLTDALLEQAPCDADVLPILDAVNGALFDAAWNEMAHRVPILVNVRRGFGPIV